MSDDAPISNEFRDSDDGFLADDDSEVAHSEIRCPCVLLLDTSGSMDGKPIEELNAGIKAFEGYLKADMYARARVELLIITFGGTPSIVQNWAEIDNFTAPTLSADGETPLGGGITLALMHLDSRIKLYKSKGEKMKQPWVVIISDGKPSKSDWDDFQAASAELRDRATRNKVDVYTFAVRDANTAILQQCGIRPTQHITGLDFKGFFKLLTRNMTANAMQG